MFIQPAATQAIAVEIPVKQKHNESLVPLAAWPSEIILNSPIPAAVNIDLRPHLERGIPDSALHD